MRLRRSSLVKSRYYFVDTRGFWESSFHCSGEILAEDVLQWLILQKTEDRIETVTRGMLESIVVNVQYLAVYFCEWS